MRGWGAWLMVGAGARSVRAIENLSALPGGRFVGLTLEASLPCPNLRALR